ncbi:uncharacterized protein [Solanum lycopersicum]|uniref:uncharacterized protein n=1 Tax=Solanum lycopersicum TaxID=4081 RepID=UPI000532D0A9|nr:uncharacterized protein LOC104648871 [Solanum lycopersicum]
MSSRQSKEGRATMLIVDMDISRLMVYMQQVEEEKLIDREEFKNKRAKIRKRGSIAQGGGKPPACSKCGRNHSGTYRKGSTSCFKCVQNGNFMRKCPKNKKGYGNGGNTTQSSSVAPLNRAAPRGTTSSNGGGTNHLYVINSRQEDSPDTVTGMIQVFDLTIYALLDPEASLYFVTPYVAMNVDVIPEQLNESFNVSTPVGEYILADTLS